MCDLTGVSSEWEDLANDFKELEVRKLYLIYSLIIINILDY